MPEGQLLGSRYNNGKAERTERLGSTRICIGTYGVASLRLQFTKLSTETASYVNDAGALWEVGKSVPLDHKWKKQGTIVSAGLMLAQSPHPRFP